MSPKLHRWLALSVMTLVGYGSATVSAASSKSREPIAFRVYFGTYTGGKSQGIYASRLDATTGMLSDPELVGESKNPSFLAIHPDGKLLYSVGEVDNFDGKKVGAVAAWSVDGASGRLKALNQQSSQGGAPCHLVVDGTGRWVLVANYTGGNVAVLPITADGSLGPASCMMQHQGWSANQQRQREPHAHSINVDARNRFAVAADLGTDKLMVYEFDARRGMLESAAMPFTALAPGSGPRHFAFQPGGKLAFVINELAQTITSLKWEAKEGVLHEMTTVSSLPPGLRVEGNSTAEVQVHPNGKFVYGSNRGHNSIGVFRVEKGGRRLALVEHESTQGRTPRGFGIDPTGRWLIAGNQDSDSVVVFAIDAKTGALTPTGRSIEVGKPVCVKYLPLR